MKQLRHPQQNLIYTGEAKIGSGEKEGFCLKERNCFMDAERIVKDFLLFVEIVYSAETIK